MKSIQLKDIAADEKNSIVDGPFGSSMKTSDYVKEGKPVLQGKNITGDKFIFSDIRFITEKKAIELARSKVIVGDYLLVKIGSIGYLARIDALGGHDYAIIPANLAKIKIDENKIYPGYFEQVFKQEFIKKKLLKLSSKTAQPALSLGKIRTFEIPIPKQFEDQHHIANILCHAENLISQRKESIQLLDEFLKSTFLEMFGNPITNEKSWPLLTVSKISESRLGKMLDGKKIIGNNLKPYLRNSNVLWFKFKLDELLEMDFDEKDRLEYALKFGDILMCEGGEIGRCAIWREELEECYIQKAIHRIRLKNEHALPEYFVFMFWLYTSLGGLKKFTGAATISHLTGEKLKKMKLPIPNIDLQTKFTQIVEKTEGLRTHYQHNLHQLENLYDSLSQRAFKGELTNKD